MDYRSLVKEFENSYNKIKSVFNSGVEERFTCIFSLPSDIMEIKANTPFDPESYTNPNTGVAIDPNIASFMRINTLYVDFWADLIPMDEEQEMRMGVLSDIKISDQALLPN